MSNKTIFINTIISATKEAVAVGHMAWGKKSATKENLTYEGDFMASVLHVLNRVIQTGIARRDSYGHMTMTIELPDSVAIRAYTVMGKGAKGAKQSFDTKAVGVECRALEKALADAKACDLVLRLQRQSQATAFSLEIPDGVEICEGEVLQFTNGEAPNGVKLAHGQRSNYAYTIGVRGEELVALRPMDSSAMKTLNAFRSGVWNLVRPVAPKKVEEGQVF